MDPPSVEQGHVSVKVRHPTSQVVSNLSIPRNISSHEILAFIIRQLDLRYFSEGTSNLIIGSNPTFEGQIIPPSTKLESISNAFKPERDILEIHIKPVIVRVILLSEGRAVETKKIMIDSHSRLCDNTTLLRYCFPKMSPEDYAFQFNAKEGTPYVNTNVSLELLGFDVVKDVLCLAQVKEILKNNWQSFGTQTCKGWLELGHGGEVDDIDKFQRRYVVLLDHFLVIFKKETEPPSGVIALDQHWIKKKKDEKTGENKFILQRLHPEYEKELFGNSSTQHPVSSARGIVQKRLKDAVSNINQKMNQFLGSSHNVWVILASEDHTNDSTSESLDNWYVHFSTHCLNTGARKVFGVPLEDTLPRNSNRYLPIPVVISKSIAYLDQRLEVEGIFRLQGSANLVEHYRDQFEIGTDVDLSGCLDVHTPPTIMKQFLRELPEPLLLKSNYDPIIAIMSAKVPQEQKKTKLFELLHATVPPNFMGVLLYIMRFLNRVSRMSELNKMTLSNLGTVFGPNILRPPDDDPMRLLSDSAQINEATQILIQYESELAFMVVPNRQSTAPDFSEQNRFRLFSASPKYSTSSPLARQHSPTEPSHSRPNPLSLSSGSSPAVNTPPQQQQISPVPSSPSTSNGGATSSTENSPANVSKRPRPRGSMFVTNPLDLPLDEDVPTPPPGLKMSGPHALDPHTAHGPPMVAHSAQLPRQLPPLPPAGSHPVSHPKVPSLNTSQNNNPSPPPPNTGNTVVSPRERGPVPITSFSTMNKDAYIKTLEDKISQQDKTIAELKEIIKTLMQKVHE